MWLSLLQRSEQSKVKVLCSFDSTDKKESQYDVPLETFFLMTYSLLVFLTHVNSTIPFSEVTQSTCVFDHVAFVICVAVKEWFPRVKCYMKFWWKHNLGCTNKNFLFKIRLNCNCMNRFFNDIHGKPRRKRAIKKVILGYHWSVTWNL